MSDPILYQEKEPYYHTIIFTKAGPTVCPTVTVTYHGIKVNNDFHRLDGVLSVTEETRLVRKYPSLRYQRLAIWALFWLSIPILLLLASTPSSSLHPQDWTDRLMPYAGFLGLLAFAISKSRQDKKNWYWTTHVALNRAGSTTKLLIATFYTAPECPVVFSAEGDNSEKSYKDRKDGYDEDLTRMKAIIHALGVAIQGAGVQRSSERAVSV